MPKVEVRGGKIIRMPNKGERLSNVEKAAAAAHQRLAIVERRLELRELQLTMLMNAILEQETIPREVMEDHAERVGLQLKTVGEEEGQPAEEQADETGSA